jgi:lysophospholipase L1-like esterase
MKSKKNIFILIIFIILFLFLLFYLYKISHKDKETFNSSNKTIILLGDSILNNNNYVSSNSSIPFLLDLHLTKQNDNLINLAQDNASISSVYNQLDKIPIDLNNSNTFIILSVGGNDLLNLCKYKYKDINQIMSKYDSLINSIQSRLPSIHLILMNLYYPFEFEFESESNNSKHYYSLIEKWNNHIENYSHKQINLTKIINNSNDFINIEPSSIGGQKIVQHIINNI